jgi:type II secretory pathway pseudopilin PulG
MQNAMQQRQMQMREFEFGQTQQEAARAEQARQAQMARQRAQMQFRGGSMYPSQQPQQAAPASPMMGGAPIEQVQGQSFVDPATGQEGSSYTATAMQRGPAPTQEEELDFLMRDAFTRGDTDGFNQYFDLRRQNMSAEEKAGRELISNAAGQILRLPVEQRGQAVMLALQQYGVDPSTTQIDDYIDNPEKLEQSLRFEMIRGAPGKSAEENIRVQGTFDQFRPLERQDLGNRVDVFDPRTGQFQSGPSIGVSPNTNVTAGVQRRGQNMTDARAIRSQQTNLPAGFILNGN